MEFDGVEKGRAREGVKLRHSFAFAFPAIKAASHLDHSRIHYPFTHVGGYERLTGLGYARSQLRF